MPFILIPETSTPPKLKFQYYPTIDKNIYIHLFTTILKKLHAFINDSVNKFNINVIENKPDNTKMSFSQILLNVLAYSQGMDYSLDTLYYEGVSDTEEDKEKLNDIIDDDFDKLIKAVKEWQLV